MAPLLLPTQPSLLISRNSPFIHRDLSWIQFNERVLTEARQTSNPLLERLKFLAITASNLDEFFMIRFSSLNRSILTAKTKDSRLENRLKNIRRNILEAVAKFGNRQVDTLHVLIQELSEAKVRIIRKPKPDDPAFEIGKKIFTEQILPQISVPEEFSVNHLGALLNHQLGILVHRSWFKIPRNFQSVFMFREGKIFYAFFLDDLLLSHIADAFRLEGKPGVFRLTRDGDVSLDLEEEDTASIPDIIRSGIGIREKGKPVRLQYVGDISPALIHRLQHHLKFETGQIFPAPSTLCLHGLWTVFHGIPEESSGSIRLKYPPIRALSPSGLSPKKLFDRLKTKDYLLHHPYDSFDAIVDWIKTAATDPKVTVIEQTVYRIDTLSAITDHLKTAAKSKKVRVIIELRARFDELNNLQLADDLRKAGVEVAFGFGKLKLHAKIALITRQEESGLRLYTHLSTGNYNAATARQYTDLSLLTSQPEIGEDARHFFDSVFQKKIPSTFKQLVSAPLKLHRRLLQLIQAETEAAKAGRKARIVAKVNALVDESVVEQLYVASKAGVQVDLIVRGACSLIPGVKGLSENIRVVSIVDRFLEHSRIYYFADSNALYLSSADWMPRNFFSRLELAFPILDPKIYQYLEEILIPAYISDTTKARELTPQGHWKKRGLASLKADDKRPLAPILGTQPVNTQSFFEILAATKYQGTPLESRKVPKV